MCILSNRKIMREKKITTAETPEDRLNMLIWSDEHLKYAFNMTKIIPVSIVIFLSLITPTVKMTVKNCNNYSNFWSAILFCDDLNMIYYLFYLYGFCQYSPSTYATLNILYKIKFQYCSGHCQIFCLLFLCHLHLDYAIGHFSTNY